MKKTELTFDQVNSEMASAVTSRSKIGISVYSILINKWDEYQSEYLRQKPYREAKAENQENAEDGGPKPVTQVTPRGEEGRLEEIRGEEPKNDPPNSKPSLSPLLSSSNPKYSSKGNTVKEEFLGLLQDCKGYPFNEALDSILFDSAVLDCPGINILEQTRKKIAWWKDHPEALNSNSREQLQRWFGEETQFRKRGGPQKIGEIMKELKDPDHRNWAKQFLQKTSR